MENVKYLPTCMPLVRFRLHADPDEKKRGEEVCESQLIKTVSCDSIWM